MRIIGIVSLVAASAIGLSAMGVTAFAADAPAKGSSAKPDDLDRVVCKAPEEGDTGTRLPPKKSCHTKREWNEISDNARRLMEDRVTHQNNPTQH